MFWKGKVTTFTQLWAFMKKQDVSLASLPIPQIVPKDNRPCSIQVASINDVPGIVRLLNAEYDTGKTKAKTAVNEEWLRATFLLFQAIWIVAKDRLGTVRGCVTSFKSFGPYPNAFGGCSMTDPWGLVDWYCVHALWREKGVGSDMLEVLDAVTYKIGRKAHVFLKEGLPLLGQLPVYSTFLRCRRAGNVSVKKMREGTGLGIMPYQCNDEDGLPLVKVDGIRGYKRDEKEIEKWEDALDNELPPCWVFVTGADHISEERGWQLDTMVSMYAFRWIPGRWLGGIPDIRVL
jgi:hypothetical protein